MKDLSKTSYTNYMRTVNHRLTEIDQTLTYIEDFKIIANLSYENWVKWQNNEITIAEIRNDIKNK